MSAGLDYLPPLLLALLLGGAIGLERELNGRPAGLRTHILVCLSATMLILISRSLGAETVPGEARTVFDPNRMGAGIVTGIGFLGAATVVRSGDVLRGLTTAACIWFVAGLGIVLGAGEYGMAVVCTAVVLLVLTVVNRVALAIPPTIYRRLIVLSSRDDVAPLADEVRRTLESEDMNVLDIASGRDNEAGVGELVFTVSLKYTGQAPRLTERVARLEGVRQTRWKSMAA